MADKFEDVFYIAGNAEYMGGSNPRLTTVGLFASLEWDNMREGFRNIIGLQQTLIGLGKVADIPVTIIGTTLWSKIRDDAPPGTHDPFKGNSKIRHNLKYDTEIRDLRNLIRKTRVEKPDHWIIVMTHHAPTIRVRLRYDSGDGATAERV